MGKRKRGERLGGKGRFSVRRKREAVVRLLRGEDLDSLSRELGVTAATLSGWRDAFIAGGEANLKARTEEPRDAEVRELKAMIGDLRMRNELLREKARMVEEARPLALRRSKP